MKVAVALRGGENRTNMRSLALANGLRSAGVKVGKISRSDRSDGYDLIIQTGFSSSVALTTAIERRCPYIIAEAPCFRDLYSLDRASNFTYNGLAGGGWRPPAPKEERLKPELLPLKTEGGILIIGQKPTDHSLRGSDHVQWLQDRMEEYPEARVRQHPLMVSDATNATLESDLATCLQVITYTSTVAIDGLAAGCKIKTKRGSEAHGYTDRERLFHELSWSTFTHEELSTGDVGRHILGGFETARERAELGLQEIPRPRVNGPAICKRYYDLLKDMS